MVYTAMRRSFTHDSWASRAENRDTLVDDDEWFDEIDVSRGVTNDLEELPRELDLQ